MRYDEDLGYGPEPQHKYDLATVVSDVLLVIVHGGGWVGGDKQDNNTDNGKAVKYVAKRYGINVASVNYTLATGDVPTAPLSIDGPKPRPTHNIMTAAKVIATRVGARRVVLLGTSAGANISALTYKYYPDVIDGFIGFYGAYDLTRMRDFMPLVQDMATTYTGAATNKIVESSPALGEFPSGKFLLYHGNEDTTVRQIQSALMANAHPDGELHIVDGVGHAFKPFGEKDSPAPWTERLIRYINTGE